MANTLEIRVIDQLESEGDKTYELHDGEGTILASSRIENEDGKYHVYFHDGKSVQEKDKGEYTLLGSAETVALTLVEKVRDRT